MQVPDAVYHLMRHTELKRCDLSGNVITKIPPKFAMKFSLITGECVYYDSLSLFVSKIFLWVTTITLPSLSFRRAQLESQSNEQTARGAFRLAGLGDP